MPGLGTIIKGLFGGEGTSKTITSIGSALDGLITSKEEKAAAMLAIEAELNRHNEALEVEVTKRMELEIEGFKAEHANTASAREMNAKVQESDKASWLSKNVAYILDIFVTVVWCGMTVFLIARALKLAGEGADLTAVLSIYATVTAIFATVLNYHRGSTAGSARKDKAIQSMANK